MVALAEDAKKRPPQQRPPRGPNVVKAAVDLITPDKADTILSATKTARSVWRVSRLEGWAVCQMAEK